MRTMNPYRIANDYLQHKKNLQNQNRKPYSLRKFVRQELRAYSHGHRLSGWLVDKWVGLVKTELNKMRAKSIRPKPSKENRPENQPKLSDNPQRIREAQIMAYQRHDYLLPEED
jgi:hypothetical protein